MNVRPPHRAEPLHSIPVAADHATLCAELERRLAALVTDDARGSCQLHPAMRHALLSGGKRLRPRLVLAVARSCAAAGDEIELALRAACAVELVHAASLVHDDLPCFDDAATRRGQPTVHVRFGEPSAVLAGDALLTLAFEVLADAPPSLSRPALELVRLLALAVGAREGIIGGQALELAPDDSQDSDGRRRLERYHAGKTAALFRFAAQSGAVAARAVATDPWADVGRLVGLAHQAAD